MTSPLGTFKELNGQSHKSRPDTYGMFMKRCVSYKGQFVSDGKDPLRARSDHHGPCSVAVILQS